MAKKEIASKTLSFLRGTLYLFAGTLLLLTLCFPAQTHPLGLFGRTLNNLLYYLFGLLSFAVPLPILYYGIHHLTSQIVDNQTLKKIAFLLWFFSTALLLNLAETALTLSFSYHLGGTPLYYLYNTLPYLNLRHLLGPTGTLLCAAFTCLLSIALFFQEWFFSLFKKRPKETSLPPQPIVEPFEPSQPRIKLAKPKETTPVAMPQARPKTDTNYTLPPPTLLTETKKPDLSFLKADLQKLSAILEQTLQNFNIDAKVGNIHCGPTIISFEVHPAVGVKVQRIKALENDIALNMQAKSIRIIAPIPGKAAVGIEIPSPHPQEVNFKELLEIYQNSPKKGRLPLLLGKAVNGEEIFADLSKTPHLLIAGATGSGKSVCINTLVMSLLMTSYPDEVKFLMVDPKKVELSAYSQLPHMMAPVITEAEEARGALLFLVREMEKRYEIFRHLGFRNIEGFNCRTPNSEKETALEMDIPKTLPYIVLIIDEFADLILSTTSDIETPIARIAQMARATGIHMILATQRPSREVITGLIKANFPSRIAFKVANRVNSQIIIDENGAETLLGNGDMLFLPPGTSTLSRAQGVYIRDEDIHKILDFIKAQGPPSYAISSFRDYKSDELEILEEEGGGGDALFEEAKALVLETGTASTTYLQRKLKIGYARAAGLMDDLEKNKVIGPQEGAKPRRVFYPKVE